MPPLAKAISSHLGALYSLQRKVVPSRRILGDLVIKTSDLLPLVWQSWLFLAQLL